MLSPDVYRADSSTYTVPYDSSTTYVYYESGGAYAHISFSSETATVSIPTSVTHFRIVKKLGFTLKEGQSVSVNDLTLKVINGTYDNSNSFAWFGVPQSNIYATNSMSSIKRGVGYIGNWGYTLSGTFSMTADSQYLWIDYYVTGRTSTSVYQPFHGCTIDVYQDSDVSDVVAPLDEMNNKASNIFEALSNMLLHIADIVVDVSNMPVAIKNNLSSLFDGLADLLDGGFTNLPSNLASALSGYFLDLPSRLKDALSSCFDAVTVSMDNVLAFLPDDMADVLKPVFDDFGLDFVSMITWLSSIDERIGTLANNFAAGLGLELPSDYWNGFVGIFIPSEDDLQVVFDKFDGLFSEKFGFFYEIVDLVSLYVNTLTSDTYAFTPEGDGHFEATIDLPIYTVDLAGTDFSIGGWSVPLIPNGLESYFEAFRTGINVLCTILFVNGMKIRFDAFLGLR